MQDLRQIDTHHRETTYSFGRRVQFPSARTDSWNFLQLGSVPSQAKERDVSTKWHPRCYRRKQYPCSNAGAHLGTCETRRALRLQEKAAKLIGLKSRHVVALAVLVATLVVGMPVGVRADEKPSNPQAEQLQAQLVEMRKQMDAMQKELDSKDIPPERRTMLRHDMDSMRHNWQDMHDHCRW